MRRLLVLLFTVVAALLVIPAAADASSCVRVGTTGVKRCESVRKQVCKSGDPTVCERSRSVCRIHQNGWFRCEYVAKYARCRGYGGRRCQTTWTRCDSVPGRKTCRRNQLESCRTRKDGSSKCYRKVDTCTTRSRGRYDCTNLYEQRDCPKEGACTVFRKTCRSRNGYSRASCRAVKYTEPQDAPVPEPPPDPAAPTDPVTAAPAT